MCDKIEMIIGFIHNHRGKNSQTFVSDDIMTISQMSLGEIPWTNVPQMAEIKIDHGWVDKIASVKVLHNNPGTIDKMFFGVFYSGGYDYFSWKLTAQQYLSAIYSNIWLIGAYSNYRSFLNNPGIYGAEYRRR